MRKNIWVHLEYKDDVMGIRNLARVHFQLDYDLVSLLSGVRYSSALKPVVEPRGLPEDISIPTKFARAKTKDLVVAESWLNLHELENVQARYTSKHGSANTELSAVIAAMKALPSNSNPRLVFWVGSP